MNPSTLTWTATGSGKFDIYDEEGMTLLPGGNVLDVDAYVFQYNSAGKNWETYNPGYGRLDQPRQHARAVLGFGRQLRWLGQCDL